MINKSAQRAHISAARLLVGPQNPNANSMLPKSPESAHKKLELIAPVFFKLSSSVKVLHTDVNT